MTKIIYEVCPHCGKENECYKTPYISKGVKTKGKPCFIIHCQRLDKINLEAASRINKGMSELFFGKR